MKKITTILLLFISISAIGQVSPPSSHTIKVAGSGTSGGTTKYSTTEYGMLTDSATAGLYKFRADSTVLESQARAVNRSTVLQNNINSLIESYETLIPSMAFYSDGTDDSLVLRDLSGNSRNGIVTSNIMTDSSAEYGTIMLPWNGADSISNSTDFARTGTRSFKFVKNNVTSLKGQYSNKFRTVTGETIAYSFWVYKTVGTSFTFDIIKGSGSGGSVVGGGGTPALNTWVNYSGTYTETAGGGNAFFAFYITSGSLTLYVDDFSITVVNKKNCSIIMANDTTLKLIDGSNNLFYTSIGAPKTIRTDISNPAIYNQQIYDGGVRRYIFYKQIPDAKTHYVTDATFTDHDNYFDRVENIVSVKKDGTGNYTSIKAAVDAITTATATNRYRIDVYDSDTAKQWTDYQNTIDAEKVLIFPKGDMILNGIGTINLYGNMPDSASDATAKNVKTLELVYRGGIRNINFYKNNGGYTVHMDGTPMTDNRIKVYKCNFYNSGIGGLIAYRIANSLPAPNVSGAPTIGMGLITGSQMSFINCNISGLTPFYIHDGTLVTKSKLIFLNSTITALPVYHPVINPLSEVKYSMDLLNIGASTPCDIWVLKSSVNSYIRDSGYYTSVAKDLYRLHKLNLTAYQTPLTITKSFDGGSLRITSATNGAVHIIAGSAMGLIMLNPDEKLNYATGRLEVGGWAFAPNAALGVRLGNCSVTNKTLTLTIDGVLKTITFNQNHTAQSNATVLSFINTALAGSGTATLYQRANEYLPTIIY